MRLSNSNWYSLTRLFFVTQLTFLVPTAHSVENHIPTKCEKDLMGTPHQVNSTHLPRFVPQSTVHLALSFPEQAVKIRQEIDARLNRGATDPNNVHVPYFSDLLGFYLGILDEIGPDKKKALAPVLQAATDFFFSSYQIEDPDFLKIDRMKEEALQHVQNHTVTAKWFGTFVGRVIYIRDLYALLLEQRLTQREANLLLDHLPVERIMMNSSRSFVSVPVFNLQEPADFFPFWMHGLNPESVTDVLLWPNYDGLESPEMRSRTSTGFFGHDGAHSYFLSARVEKLASLANHNKMTPISHRFFSFLPASISPAPQNLETDIISGVLKNALLIIDQEKDPDRKFFLTNLTWILIHETLDDRTQEAVLLAAYGKSVGCKVGRVEVKNPAYFSTRFTDLAIDDAWKALSKPILTAAVRLARLDDLGWIYPGSWRKINGNRIESIKVEEVDRALRDFARDLWQ